MSKNTRNRILLTAVAALLLVAVAVGGTMAWLQDTTEPVTNTFTPTNIDVTLTETKPAQNGGSAQVIPGVDIEKNPLITATATDKVAYWVFVEVTENNWFDGKEVDGNTRKVSYAIDDAWTLLGTNAAGAKVYYQADNDGGNFSDYVLAGNDKYANGVVTVSENLTDEEMASLTTMGTLSFKAYAIQQAAMDDVQDAYETAANTTVTLEPATGD